MQQKLLKKQRTQKTTTENRKIIKKINQYDEKTILEQTKLWSNKTEWGEKRGGKKAEKIKTKNQPVNNQTSKPNENI